MKKSSATVFLASLLVLALVTWRFGFSGTAGEASASPGAHPFPDSALLETARSLFGTLGAALPAAVAAPDAVLGRHLFWDERISSDGKTSCASCHTSEAWSSDARRYSTDARGRLTGRNSQPVFNAMEQPSIRWLGDRQDGAHQAELSIVGSMGFADADALVPVLLDHGYDPLFRAAFPGDPDPISPANYGRALEAYQRTLVTPAPFDAYLEGTLGALSPEQERGLELFVSAGCVACHTGPLLGGQSFTRFGLARPYWEATLSEPVDEGRFAVTGEEGDRYVFRTPMLRNVARTAPYFHDGSAATLGDAVRVMADVQLGRTLEDADVERLVSFLESLTGEVPAHYAPPER